MSEQALAVCREAQQNHGVTGQHLQRAYPTGTAVHEMLPNVRGGTGYVGPNATADAVREVAATRTLPPAAQVVPQPRGQGGTVLRRAARGQPDAHPLPRLAPTFGTLAAQKLPIRTVQELMGHAHIGTTLIYTHYVPAAEKAALLGQAFRGAPAATQATRLPA